MKFLLPFRWLGVVGAIASTLLTAPADAAPRTAKAAAATTAAAPSDGSYRARVGSADVFVPAWLEPVDGTYDVVFHFHGLARAQESNATAAKLNAVVVSVNLGVASDKYEAAYRDPHAFEALVATAQRVVAASQRAKGARGDLKMGRIALSAWSAGFASVSAILKQESVRSRVDAVLLADGLHAAYADPKRHVIEERSLAKYARLTEQAARGEKLFVLTHSSIPTNGYANVADTVGAVLRLASIEKGAPPDPATAPRHMRPIYQVNRGDLHITGYEGHGVSDHIDHIWAMGETMFPLLAARWDKKTASQALAAR